MSSISVRLLFFEWLHLAWNVPHVGFVGCSNVLQTLGSKIKTFTSKVVVQQVMIHSLGELLFIANKFLEYVFAFHTFK